MFEKSKDDFWNLDEYVKPKKDILRKEFSKSSTTAVEIESVSLQENTSNAKKYTDISLNNTKASQDGTITRFIPPHSDSAFAKKYTLWEYSPENPLIKSVKIYSEKPDESLFVESNLFIRERRALLSRRGVECERASYYSYSPRYSQMSRAQLNWYLWWRENTRNGIFPKTDETYIILYAYELCAAGEGEDKQAALDMLCNLLCEYSEKEISIVFRMMIRDLICDFCLLHGLPTPIERLNRLDRGLLSNAFLPEFFIDFSERNRSHAVKYGIFSLSLYDFKRSKFYSEHSEIFKSAINGAINAMITDEKAFRSITSFTDGVYGCVTLERRPFSRMVNIVNKNVKFEITYFQISNIQAAITDAVRYSENRLREHLGIKGKLNILSVNPSVKAVIDRFFEESYPPKPLIDRRRKTNGDREEEAHEYDRFYDVPKAEISPERALEIERESWDTTKILTEAFSDENNAKDDNITPLNTPELIIEPVVEHVIEKTVASEPSAPIEAQDQSNGGLWEQIKAELGDIADLIGLCSSPSPIDQRRFASSHGVSLDEIADRINECAANIFGDIILEDTGGAYGIIEDYVDQI